MTFKQFARLKRIEAGMSQQVCAEALGQWTLTAAADEATTLTIRNMLLGQAALPDREPAQVP